MAISSVLVGATGDGTEDGANTGDSATGDGTGDGANIGDGTGDGANIGDGTGDGANTGDGTGDGATGATGDGATGATGDGATGSTGDGATGATGATGDGTGDSEFDCTLGDGLAALMFGDGFIFSIKINSYIFFGLCLTFSFIRWLDRKFQTTFDLI